MLKRPIFFIFLAYLSCSSPSSIPESATWLSLSGRNNEETLDRELVYRLRVPNHWTYTLPSPNDSLFDSKKSLAEFYIDTDIKISVHNFPATTLETRTPPQAQISRWEKQFDVIDYTSTSTTPQAFGGFSGYLYEASGLLNNQPIRMMAWIMQMAPEHFRQLDSNQMRADYTIKVVGPINKVHQYSQEIIKFSRSFELIEEILSKS